MIRTEEESKRYCIDALKELIEKLEKDETLSNYRFTVDLLEQEINYDYIDSCWMHSIIFNKITKK